MAKQRCTNEISLHIGIDSPRDFLTFVAGRVGVETVVPVYPAIRTSGNAVARAAWTVGVRRQQTMKTELPGQGSG